MLADRGHQRDDPGVALGLADFIDQADEVARVAGAHARAGEHPRVGVGEAPERGEVGPIVAGDRDTTLADAAVAAEQAQDHPTELVVLASVGAAVRDEVSGFVAVPLDLAAEPDRLVEGRVGVDAEPKLRERPWQPPPLQSTVRTSSSFTGPSRVS